jgi:hypothetical protein
MCALSEFLLMDKHEVTGDVEVIVVVDLVMNDLSGIRNASVPAQRHTRATENIRSVIVKEGLTE